MVKAKKKTYDDPEISIFQLLKSIDLKEYDYYEKLNEEQKKKIACYVLFRWAACVEGNNDISKYYTISANSFINENFFDLGKHPKLQWLLICAGSPNVGAQKHYWLGSGKKGKGNPLRTFILEKFPHMKLDEIDLMLTVTSQEEIKIWLKNLGLEEKEVKKLLS